MSLQSSQDCRGLGVIWWCLKHLKGDIRLFWDLLLGLQASGLTHPIGLGASQRAMERLSGSHMLPLALPAQPAGDQPGLAGQGEHGPGSQDLLIIIEAFSLRGQKCISLLRMNYKANCSCVSSKANEVRKLLLLQSLKMFVCPRQLQCKLLPPSLSGALLRWDPASSPSSLICCDIIRNICVDFCPPPS